MVTDATDDASITDELSRSPVRDLTPAARLIYTILRDIGPCTQTELHKKGSMHPETVRRSIEQLRKADLLIESKGESPSYREYQVDPSPVYSSGNILR